MTINNTRRRLLPALTLLFAALLLAAFVPARAQTPPKPRVYAVVFLASWCANCKELGPKAAHVLPPFIAKGILPIQLDMSDAAARQKSLATANTYGLRPLAAGEDGTGFIVLVDAKSKARLGRITSNLTEAQMSAAMRQALSQTK